MKEKFKDWKPMKVSFDRITNANEIIEEYTAAGYDLTLRQLFYQLVARNLLENTHSNYKRLINTMRDARLAGLTDWNAIVDRTRSTKANSHWSKPQEILKGCADQFRFDLWKTQEVRVEAWIEKDALIGVLARPCTELDIAYFSTRGNCSMTALYNARRRFALYSGQTVIILHLADHDPTGIDMTRDLRDRFETLGTPVEIRRIALNMNQVQEFNPPPNPVKAQDNKSAGYVEKFGESCWELDALTPGVISDLIKEEVESLMDADLMDTEQARQDAARDELDYVAQHYTDIIAENFGDPF